MNRSAKLYHTKGGSSRIFRIDLPHNGTKLLFFAVPGFVSFSAFAKAPAQLQLRPQAL